MENTVVMNSNDDMGDSIGDGYGYLEHLNGLKYLKFGSMSSQYNNLCYRNIIILIGKEFYNNNRQLGGKKRSNSDFHNGIVYVQQQIKANVNIEVSRNEIKTLKQLFQRIRIGRTIFEYRLSYQTVAIILTIIQIIRNAEHSGRLWNFCLEYAKNEGGKECLYRSLLMQKHFSALQLLYDGYQRGNIIDDRVNRLYGEIRGILDQISC